MLLDGPMISHCPQYLRPGTGTQDFNSLVVL